MHNNSSQKSKKKLHKIPKINRYQSKIFLGANPDFEGLFLTFRKCLFCGNITGRDLRTDGYEVMFRGKTFFSGFYS